MSGDAGIDRDLRAMLANRDPGPAPARLAASVGARLAAERGTRRETLLERLTVVATAVTMVAAGLILLVVVNRPISISPGAAPLPTLPYTIQPGDGVVHGEDVPVFQVLFGGIVLIGLATILATTAARWKRIGAALAMLMVAFVALTIGMSDAIGFASGIDGIERGRNPPDGQAGIVVGVVGDRPFTMYLTVTNTSRLRLEVEGLAEPPTFLPPMVVQPRFVGLGIIPDVSVDLTDAPRAPFRPVTLEPGASLDLAVLGMAGQCAISPPSLAGVGYTWLDHIGIVYEQLTIRHQASVALPEPVKIAEPDACP